MDENITNSFFNSIKKLIGISPEDTSFDEDILFHINAAFFTLYQVGGISQVVRMESVKDTLDDLVGDRIKEKDAILLYVAYKVRLGFDPPSSGSVMESLKGLIQELEWRLQVSSEIDNGGDSYG